MVKRNNNNDEKMVAEIHRAYQKMRAKRPNLDSATVLRRVNDEITAAAQTGDEALSAEERRVLGVYNSYRKARGAATDQAYDNILKAAHQKLDQIGRTEQHVETQSAASRWFGALFNLPRIAIEKSASVLSAQPKWVPVAVTAMFVIAAVTVLLDTGPFSRQSYLTQVAEVDVPRALKRLDADTVATLSTELETTFGFTAGVSPELYAVQLGYQIAGLRAAASVNDIATVQKMLARMKAAAVSADLKNDIETYRATLSQSKSLGARLDVDALHNAIMGRAKQDGTWKYIVFGQWVETLYLFTQVSDPLADPLSRQLLAKAADFRGLLQDSKGLPEPVLEKLLNLEELLNKPSTGSTESRATKKLVADLRYLMK
jgi:hypothetical protein